MTPTDLPSPAPDRAVEDVLSEEERALIQRYTQPWGPAPSPAVGIQLAELAARLSDALSQPVAQPEGLSEPVIDEIGEGDVVVVEGRRWGVEYRLIDVASDYTEVQFGLYPLAPPLPGEPRQEGGGG